MISKEAAKLIAINMIYESSLSKTSKIQLVRFVEDASINQLSHFILHQEIVKEDETSINEFVQIAAITALAVAAGSAAYSKYFSDAAKACSDKKGMDKKICIKGYKLKGMSAKISALRKEMSKCNQTLKPDKCRKTFQKYIKNIEKQIIKLRAK